jgi:hypothetical protein
MLLWWHWVLIWSWTGGGVSLAGYFFWKGIQPPKYPLIVKELEGHAYLKENSWGEQQLVVHRHIEAGDLLWLNSMLSGIDSHIRLRFEMDAARKQKVIHDMRADYERKRRSAERSVRQITA